MNPQAHLNILPTIGRCLRRPLLTFIAIAVISLSAFGQESDVDWPAVEAQLSQAIAQGTNEQKRDALFATRNYRTERASRLALPALSDPDEIIRATAASSVVFLPPSEAVQRLIPLLSDRQPFVRKEAAYSLQKVGSPDAANSLIPVFSKDRDLEVRAAAAIALGASGNPSSVAPLTAFLRSRPREENEFIRRSAARSIGQIAQIILTGRTKVNTPESFLPDEYKTGPVRSANVLSPAFDAAIPVLNGVLKNTRESDDTRREAAFSLGAIGSEASTASLRSYVNSPDPYLAEIASEALLKAVPDPSNR